MNQVSTSDPFEIFGSSDRNGNSSGQSVENSSRKDVSHSAAVSTILGTYNANGSAHNVLHPGSSNLFAVNGTGSHPVMAPLQLNGHPQFVFENSTIATAGTLQTRFPQSILKSSSTFANGAGILRSPPSVAAMSSNTSVTADPLESLFSRHSPQTNATSLHTLEHVQSSSAPVQLSSTQNSGFDPLTVLLSPSPASFDPFNPAACQQATGGSDFINQSFNFSHSTQHQPTITAPSPISESPIRSSSVPTACTSPTMSPILNTTGGRRPSRRIVTVSDLRSHAENASDDSSPAAAAGCGGDGGRLHHHVHFAAAGPESSRQGMTQWPSGGSLKPSTRMILRPLDEDEIPPASPAGDVSTHSHSGGSTAGDISSSLNSDISSSTSVAADKGGVEGGTKAAAAAKRRPIGRSERRVRTVNDLRSFQKELEMAAAADEAAAEGSERSKLDDLVSASRPLTPRVRDPAKETRMEMFQSQDLFGQYGKKERDMLEKRRSARQARHKKTSPSSSKEELYESDGASDGGDSTPPSAADTSGRRKSFEQRIRDVNSVIQPKLKRIQREANKQLRQIDPALKARVRKTEELRTFWIKVFLSCVIGVCTGICVQFISLLSTQVLMNPKQSTVQALLHEGKLMVGFLLHAGVSVLLALMTSVIVVGLPGPLTKLYPGCAGAGGSGLPETRTLIAKIFALSLLIASGIPASRDMIHVAALIATNVISRWIPWEQSLARKKIAQPLFQFSDAPKFVMVSAAVAAGVGASFRCPFAGIIFAFEEFSSYWSQETASMCMLASGVASLVAWYFTGTESSSQWYLSNFEDTSGQFDPSMIRIVPAAFAMVRYPTLKVLELGVLVLLGVLGGLWGSVFVLCNGYGLAHWRKRHMGGKYAKYKRFAEIALVGVFTSAVAVLLPYLWPCRPLMPEEESALLEKGQRISWKTSTCAPGLVNEMASLCFQGQGTAMNNLFAESGDMQFSESVLFVYGAVYFIVTVVSVGTASPAGAVIPMVLSGAAWGRCLGVVFHDTFNWVGNQHPHVRFYAVMGGAAALAGFFRMPLAVTAMIVEIAGNSAFTAPLFISCTVAKITADRVTKGFINFMCQFNDYPLLKEAPPRGFYDRNALDIMTELDNGIAYAPLMIGRGDGVDHAKSLLDSTKHGSFPVVVDRSQDWTLLGLVERKYLAELAEEHLGKGLSVEDFQKDLAATMQINPTVVNEGMPADRVYNLCVSLGFRRLLVVKDGTMEVTGIITRHDLHEAFIKWKV